MKALPTHGPTAGSQVQENLSSGHGTGPVHAVRRSAWAAVEASLPAQACCPVGLGRSGWRGCPGGTALRLQLWVLPSRRGSRTVPTAMRPRLELESLSVLASSLVTVSATSGSSWSGLVFGSVSPPSNTHRCPSFSARKERHQGVCSFVVWCLVCEEVWSPAGPLRAPAGH